MAPWQQLVAIDRLGTLCSFRIVARPVVFHTASCRGPSAIGWRLQCRPITPMHRPLLLRSASTGASRTSSAATSGSISTSRSCPRRSPASRRSTSCRRDEKLLLNQIRGHGYLYMFGLVEEFILPFVLDHARPRLRRRRLRAARASCSSPARRPSTSICSSASAREFEAGFGTACEVIGPPEAIGRGRAGAQPLAVALLILQIEWMTQRHYVESVRDDQDLDPQFKSLLRHHWMEEAQHAKLDTLMVEASSPRACREAEIVSGRRRLPRDRRHDRRRR